MAAARTGEALRPPEPVQIVEAIRIGPEPRLELTHRPRIVLSSARLLHTSSLLRLNGYPRSRYIPAYLGSFFLFAGTKALGVGIADGLARRSSALLREVKKGDVRLVAVVTYSEHVRSSVAAMRKQLAHLTPSLRYLRERRDRIEVLTFVRELAANVSGLLQRGRVAPPRLTPGYRPVPSSTSVCRATPSSPRFTLRSRPTSRPTTCRGSIPTGAGSISLRQRSCGGLARVRPARVGASAGVGRAEGSDMNTPAFDDVLTPVPARSSASAGVHSLFFCFSG